MVRKATGHPIVHISGDILLSFAVIKLFFSGFRSNRKRLGVNFYLSINVNLCHLVIKCSQQIVIGPVI